MVSSKDVSKTGIWKAGKAHVRLLYQFSAKYDATVRTSHSHGTNITNRVTKTIATNHDGTDFVSFGRKCIIAIVRSIKKDIISSSHHGSHVQDTLNCPICAKKIIIARPFTKPSITGWGISLTNLQNLNIPNNIWRIPINIKVANKYSIPYVTTNEVITTARAPVAHDIIHGLHQNIAVRRPTINAACKPTIGFTHATNENAIASGTRAKATVSHDRISTFSWFLSCSSWKNQLFCIYDSRSIWELGVNINKNSRLIWVAIF